MYTLIFMGCILALSETVFRLDRAHERNLVLKALFTAGSVIARKPIFRQMSGREAFLGFAIVLIYIDDLLPDSLFF